MKQIIVLIVISFIWSCKSESEFSSNQNQLRMDGIYVAVNQFASSKPDTLNGSLKTRKSLNILRFYNNSVGVIIPESVDEQFKFDSININRLFVWCQDFEKKNIKDKGFVNFKYQIINQDSIRDRKSVV